MVEMETIKALSDFWFQTVFTWMILFIGFKYFNNKFFWKANIEKMREVHTELDAQENEESKQKIKKVQSYLNERSEDLEKMWIDRTSVWINHNWMRNWKIHFIFYSLIAEYSARGLQRFTDSQIGSQKLPYYIFAEYEEMISSKHWPVFVSDQEILWQTSKAIASDMWTKSLVIAPICNLKWKIEWMIFFSSVFEWLEEKPNVDEIINDIRAIFIS